MKAVLVLLPFLIMAAVTAALVAMGRGLGFCRCWRWAPAFAATAGGPRLTVVVGAVALLLAAGVILLRPGTSTQREAIAFSAVGGVTAASVLVSVVRRRRERELLEVTAIVEVAQRVLLRPVPHQVDSVHLAVSYT